MQAYEKKADFYNSLCVFRRAWVEEEQVAENENVKGAHEGIPERHSHKGLQRVPRDPPRPTGFQEVPSGSQEAPQHIQECHGATATTQLSKNGFINKGMSANMKLPHEHGHQHGQIRILRARSHISSLDPKQRRALGHKNLLLSAAQY